MKRFEAYNLIIINFLFCFFPISIIIGNYVTNAIVVLLSLYTLIIYKKKVFQIKLSIFDKILIAFFVYILISLLINYFDYKINEKIFPKLIISKTFLYFRYLVLYLIVRFLVTQKIIKIETFFYLCAICSVIISVDIIFQFFNGKNIIGLTPVSIRHYSGFFGHELIAGGYIQKFSLFAFFLPIFFLKNVNYKYLFYLLIYFVFLFAIMLSGNRMPLLLYLLTIFIYIILNTETRKYFLRTFLISLLFFLIVFFSNPVFKTNIKNFHVGTKNLIISIFVYDLKETKLDNASWKAWRNPYVVPFFCAKQNIKKNPIFGGGLRSYRTLIEGCNTHPHNYYLEITSDLGVVGLFIILIFLTKLFSATTKLYILKSENFIKSHIKIAPIFLILLTEFFPFRSSGSFFTTNNSSVYFIFFALLVSFIANKEVVKH